MNIRQIRKHELIGNTIKIIDAKNKSLIGIKGIIVDETKNTIRILCNNREKTLLKEQIIFTMTINSKTVKINGETLIARPEERIKK